MPTLMPLAMPICAWEQAALVGQHTCSRLCNLSFHAQPQIGMWLARLQQHIPQRSFQLQRSRQTGCQAQHSALQVTMHRPPSSVVCMTHRCTVLGLPLVGRNPAYLRPLLDPEIQDLAFTM